VFRCLRSEIDHVWRQAALTLPTISSGGTDVKSPLLSLLKYAPTNQTIQATLFALGRGWSADADIGRIADALRPSSHFGIALESIRIRAMRGETDSSDLDRFLTVTHDEDGLDTGIPARDLVEHFAATRPAEYAARLETAIENAGARGIRHNLIPLIGSLLICDPENPLIHRHLLNLLSEDWTFHHLFSSSKFPMDRVRWTPDLVSKIEAHATKGGAVFDYELYWTSKTLALPSLKRTFIDALKRREGLSFWSARALAEVWGNKDAEVRDIFESFLDGEPKHLLLVAEELPLIVDDKDSCRAAILRALRSPLDRYDFLVSGLNNLGVSSDDDEAFAAALGAQVGKNGPLYQDQWRTRMIEAFPERPEVRTIAFDELKRRGGRIGTIAHSYSGDTEMCMRLLPTLCPLDYGARMFLVSNLEAAANANTPALQIISSARHDTVGTVSGEATIGWVEASLARGSVAAHDIEHLASELDAVGPDLDDHRAAALVGLTLTGRLDRFVEAKRYDGKPLDISVNPILRADDRYIRRLLPRWNELRKALGDDETILDRLNLSAETAFPLVRPGLPNSEHLFRLLLAKVPTTRHIYKHDLIAAISRFAPRGEEMREVITPLLTDQWGTGRTNADIWATLLASDIFAEHFADDMALRALVIDRLRAYPGHAAAAAALAELVLRRPDPEIAEILAQNCRGQSYDIGTHFKILAALAPPADFISEIERLLSQHIDAQAWGLVHWVPALLRRIKTDAEVEDAMYDRLAGVVSASISASFPALLGRASGTTERLRAYATSAISRLEQQPWPVVGFDLTTFGFRPVSHVLIELVS
jgi:hypothetical protein